MRGDSDESGGAMCHTVALKHVCGRQIRAVIFRSVLYRVPLVYNGGAIYSGRA